MCKCTFCEKIIMEIMSMSMIIAIAKKINLNANSGQFAYSRTKSCHKHIN